MDPLPLLYDEKKKKRPPLPRRNLFWLVTATVVTLALLLLALVITRPAPTADLNGMWSGTLSQDPGGITAVYGYRITFTQQDTYISGITRIWLPGDPSQYGIMEFSGNIQDNMVHLTESRIIGENLDPKWRWCLKTADLYIHDTSLAGTWTAPDCAPGRIELSHYSQESGE